MRVATRRRAAGLFLLGFLVVLGLVLCAPVALAYHPVVEDEPPPAGVATPAF